MTWTNSPWWLPGAFLVAFGVLIVLFPELLALLVASALMFAGVTWLWLGYATRKASRDARPIYVERWRYW